MGGSLFFGLGAFFAPIQLEYRWSFSVLSGAFALQYFVMGVAAFLFGWFFDRFHPAWLAVFGIAVTGLSFAALSLVKSTLGLYAVFAAMGVGGSAATSLLFNSLVALWFTRSLGLGLAVMQTGFAVGGLTAAGFVGLINSVGWRASAVLVGAGILVIGLPLCPAIRLPGSAKALRTKTKENRSGTPTHDQSPIWPEGGLGLSATLRTTAFWVIVAVIALSSAVTQAVYAHQIRAMLTFGIPAAVAGLAAGVTGIVGLTGRYGFGLLAERINSRNLLAAALLLQGVGTALLARASAGNSILWFVILFGIGQSGIFVLSPVLQRDYFGTRDFGTIQGLIMGPSLILSAVGPLAVGVAVDAVHSYRPALLIAGGLAASLAGLVFVARRKSWSEGLE